MNDSKLGSRLIFVGGSPRSGTTMIQMILNNHNQISGGPEFDRIPDIVKLRDLLKKTIDSGRIEAYCTHEQIDKEVSCFVERLLYPYANKHNTFFVSEKTPWNILYFSQLITLFPKAKFIFCVRDPRSVVNSMLQVGKRYDLSNQEGPAFTKNIYAAVQTMNKCNQAGFDAFFQDTKKILLVQYEKILQNPEYETQKICTFLNVDFCKSLLALEEGNDNTIKLADGIWGNKQTLMARPDIKRMHTWKEKLSLYQQFFIYECLKNETYLQKMDYDIIPKAQLSLIKKIIYKIRINSYKFIYKLIKHITFYIKSNRKLKQLFSYYAE